MALDFMQILSDEGVVNREEEPSIPAGDLLKLYRLMVLSRQLDDRMMKLQRQGRIAFYLQSMGEEAAILGSAYALEPRDWIFPAYRESAAAFLRGFTLKDFVCQLIGNAGDPIQGRQMPIHFSFKEKNFASVSSPVGTQIPHAVGAAWAAKIRRDPVVCMTYFGEGATSQGDFHVGLNFAGVFKVPVVFVCRNNGYAISVPVERQTASESIAIKANAYGFPGVRVDGNDLLAVYKASREAVDRARSGQGPTLIEAVTYRQGAHSSSDDPRAYRGEEEVQQYTLQDPIQRYRRYLEEKKLWDSKKEELVQEQVKEEILSAVAEAEKFGPPPIESLFEDVYAEMPLHLQEQRDYLVDYLKRHPEAREVK